MKSLFLFLAVFSAVPSIAAINPKLDQARDQLDTANREREYVLMDNQGRGICVISERTLSLPACTDDQLVLVEDVIEQSQPQVAEFGLAAMGLVAGTGCAVGVITAGVDLALDSNVAGWVGRVATAGGGFLSVGGSLPGLIVGVFTWVPYEACRGATHWLFSAPAPGA